MDDEIEQERRSVSDIFETMMKSLTKMMIFNEY